MRESLIKETNFCIPHKIYKILRSGKKNHVDFFYFTTFLITGINKLLNAKKTKKTTSFLFEFIV